MAYELWIIRSSIASANVPLPSYSLNLYNYLWPKMLLLSTFLKNLATEHIYIVKLTSSL